MTLKFTLKLSLSCTSVQRVSKLSELYYTQECSNTWCILSVMDSRATKNKESSGKSVIVLDGGIGQELVKRHGKKVSHLWSTTVTLENPELVRIMDICVTCVRFGRTDVHDRRNACVFFIIRLSPPQKLAHVLSLSLSYLPTHGILPAVAHVALGVLRSRKYSSNYKFLLGA